MSEQPDFDRTKTLEQSVRRLHDALYHIAHGQDCEYYDERRPNPCDCRVCEARRALEATRDWRFMGSHHHRVLSGFNPRETKIHTAWKKLMDDRMLGMILYDGSYDGGQPSGLVPVPSARDWYVATSVVQWLATNVGITVLEAAGFKYDQYEQDRATIEQLRVRQAEEQRRQECATKEKAGE